MTSTLGWHALTAGFPWFAGTGRFRIPAYSEFMPPPRLGLPPYGDLDTTLFDANDPHGWRVSEFDEAYQIRLGFESVANQVMGHLIKFAKDLDSTYVAGSNRRNLKGNPFWSNELAARAAHLARQRHVLLLPLSLSKTQNDRGRRQWTLFGASEQGPERAFWNSFYSAPGEELPARKCREAISALLSSAFGVATRDADELYAAGFRVLPSQPDPQFPHWCYDPLPAWTKRYLLRNDARPNRVRYLLTFRPFDALPPPIRQGYLDGTIALLPSPLSLVFWGMPVYRYASLQDPLAPQFSVLRLVNRHEGLGLRVPQFGWLRALDRTHDDRDDEVLLNDYVRTHRWERLPRDEDPVPKRRNLSSVTATLFSTALTDLDLYHKPMARNCQVWSRSGELILDGPTASRADIQRAGNVILAGGTFMYCFRFPAMRVGRHEVFWQRPLAACWDPERDTTKLLDVRLPGYLTGYDWERSDHRRPVELYPRILSREPYRDALHSVDGKGDYYRYQTALNVLNVFDMSERWPDGRLPRTFAEQMLRVAQDKQRFDAWLEIVASRCADPAVAARLTRALAQKVAPQHHRSLPAPITYGATATRAYETAYWDELVTLSHGRFVNKSSSDVVQDAPTLDRVAHPQCDLTALGDYLIDRYRKLIADAGLTGIAHVAELPFRWETDFEYRGFGGWVANQAGNEIERNILMIIPGKNRAEAVVMGDHYDTAYMEDVYEIARGGSGARIAARGADDNASATATLLLAASIYLRLAKEGRLERDVWLLHLTGEEFPADCMGARAFCQSLVEGTLKGRVDLRWIDLSGTKVVGVLVMDMIAHNRDNARNIFQISPGRCSASLELAYQAHIASLIWNEHAITWNKQPERRDRGAGVRCTDGITLPQIARHPTLEGEVRTTDNPQSSLFNTDVQIFSDIGAPCILMMENYDINRTGYHDTHDTLENIDLDYGAALSAICIETIARLATLPRERWSGTR